jgi:hypothetical protein
VVAGLFSRPKPRSPEEVFGFINDFIEGSGGEWDWDEFESVPIADPQLDAIRRKAAQMGPPNADLEGLASLLSEMRTIYPGVSKGRDSPVAACPEAAVSSLGERSEGSGTGGSGTCPPSRLVRSLCRL